MIKKNNFILILILFIFLITNLFVVQIGKTMKLNENEKITINPLDYRGPQLAYEPDSYDFGDKLEGDIYETTFEIWNTGCCQLRYNLSENCSWIKVIPEGGECYGEHDLISVYINTTNLLPGLYNYNISIISNGGYGSFYISMNVIYENFLNITTLEALNFTKDTGNGIQIPIDIRTDEEWIKEHIDTPIPENPRHHPFYELQDEKKLQEFLFRYNDSNIIIYSNSGNLSFKAAIILIENKFTGNIYNLVGGIKNWKLKGLPTIPNRAPNQPIIKGPKKSGVNIEINFTINATDSDAEYGDYLYYLINFSINSSNYYEKIIGPYSSGEETKFKFRWDENGKHLIKAKSIDRYNNESSWAYFEINIPRNKIITINNTNYLQINRFLNFFHLIK
jgi:rhodanese-related sulfurtransferase